MAKITLKGNAINTYGNLPGTGAVAPEFKLTKTDLSDATLADYKGKKVILNIFPSLDTSVCATSVRKFNAQAEKLPNTVVLCISKDLPFAHNRFCSTEGLKNVISLSQLRDDNFGKSYGVQIVDGPMAGLLSRTIVVVDESGKVVYSEQVPEIVNEPDYDSALKHIL
jgi:thioredoxin-dependent peroxiredoxin